MKKMIPNCIKFLIGFSVCISAIAAPDMLEIKSVKVTGFQNGLVQITDSTGKTDTYDYECSGKDLLLAAWSRGVTVDLEIANVGNLGGQDYCTYTVGGAETGCSGMSGKTICYVDIDSAPTTH